MSSISLQQLFIGMKLLPVMLVSFPVMATVVIKPGITLQETILSDTTVSGTDNRQITTISPGLELNYNKARLDLSLGYKVNAIFYHSSDDADRLTQNLNLSGTLNHDPGRWSSSVTANIKQTTVSVDGVQNVSDFITNDNTQELRTYGISTRYNDRLTKYIKYNTGLGVNYAGYKDSSNPDSLSANLSASVDANNRVTSQNLQWQLNMNTRKQYYSDSNLQIDNLNARLSYPVANRLYGYVSSTASRVSNSNLDYSNTSAGLNWRPNPDLSMSIGVEENGNAVGDLFWRASSRTSIRLGADMRGDDRTYSLNASLRNKRSTLSLTHVEQITTARDIALQDVTIDTETGLLIANYSLEIIPLVQKRTSLNWSIRGNKSNAGVTLYYQNLVEDSASIPDQQSRGITLTGSRTLSSRSSVSSRISQRESQSTQNNKVNAFQVSYQRNLYKNINSTALFRISEQNSDIVENEYLQKAIIFTLRATF